MQKLQRGKASYQANEVGKNDIAWYIVNVNRTLVNSHDKDYSMVC